MLDVGADSLEALAQIISLVEVDFDVGEASRARRALGKTGVAVHARDLQTFVAA
jgi:hypothetical protein